MFLLNLFNGIVSGVIVFVGKKKLGRKVIFLELKRECVFFFLVGF